MIPREKNEYNREYVVGNFIISILLTQVMEIELKKLQETITNIHEEMLYLRERWANNTSTESFFVMFTEEFLTICPMLLLQGRGNAKP